MDNAEEIQNAQDNTIPTASGSKVPRPASLQSINSSVGGAIKSEKVHPVFRLIESYDKRKLYSKGVNIAKPPKTADEYATSLEERKKSGCLFAEVSEPVWHKISNPMITAPIIAENLALPFKDLPLTGAPEDPSKLKEFEDKFIREYVGSELDDAEYEELQIYCNPDNLLTGDELQMSTSYPVIGLIGKPDESNDDKSEDGDSSQKKTDNEPELWTLKRLRKRQKLDSVKNQFAKLLKYRGLYQIPLKDKESSKQNGPPDLIPGKDVLYRIRVYRPFYTPNTRDKIVRSRHSVLTGDIVVTNRTPLCALRDKISCRNDLDMRIDLSNNPDGPPTASAKTIFPSGFLFINNVFYVDGRTGCHDTSAVVRRWAQQRGLGAFPVRRMDTLCVGDILLRLAHPEVYVHQGKCEHVFTCSEMRLLSRSDPLHLSTYPCHTLTSQNQSIYCTTCAEFTAKWLVTGSDRVPFDPAFFCETCFKEYMYKDGQKIGDFKAYAYRGNEINIKNTDYMYKDGQKIGDFKAYAYRGNEINIKNTVSNYMMVLDYN